MPSKSNHSAILDSFAKQDKQLWTQQAAQEINGDDPNEKLSWKNDDDLTFSPYYDLSDVIHLKYLNHHRLTVAQQSFLGNRKWINAPLVKSNTDKNRNADALNHLSNGADGVFFDLDRTASIADVLHSIEWNYCSLYFAGNSELAKQLVEHLQNKFQEPAKITGAFFWESVPKLSEINFLIEHTPYFGSLGIRVKQSTSVDEIVEALLKGVDNIEEFKSNHPLSNIVRSIAFSINVSASFFETIAKLKALRLLWYQVVSAYGVKTHPSQFHIHALSTKWANEKYQPHANLLKSTTAVMASIIGGADSITVEPEDEANSMMNRMARNTSSILREESHLDKVADPSAGSFLVDTMTDALAKKAWEKFQNQISK